MAQVREVGRFQYRCHFDRRLDARAAQLSPVLRRVVRDVVVGRRSAAASVAFADLSPEDAKELGEMLALLFIVELIGSIVLFATLAVVGYFGWNAFWHWWALQSGG